LNQSSDQSKHSLTLWNQSETRVVGVRSGPAHVARARDRSERQTATIDRPGMRFGLGVGGYGLCSCGGRCRMRGGKWTEPMRALFNGPLQVRGGIGPLCVRTPASLYQYGSNGVGAVPDW